MFSILTVLVVIYQISEKRTLKRVIFVVRELKLILKNVTERYLLGLKFSNLLGDNVPSV